MKVAIFSGDITSTTFIERLIVSLVDDGVKVVLHGKIIGNTSYDSKNVTKIGYTDTFGRIWLVIKFAVLFCLIKPHILLKLIKYYPSSFFSTSFLIWFVRTGPIVWYKPDIFHLQWAKGVGEWIFLQDFGIKVVVSLRGAHVNYSPIADPDLAATYRKLFPLVDGFHGVSKAVCREAAKYGAELDKCSVVHSGLNLRELQFAGPKAFKRDGMEIISVGRPHWVKGYHFALDAMKILKDQGIPFHYRIIGARSEELLFQIEDLDLAEVVTIEDKIPFEQVKALIVTSDILLLPSISEGIPNVVLEAMALGTLVVSTECGGVREVIDDSRNGFVVAIRDPDAIANKIRDIMALSNDNLNAVRLKARKTIEQQHDQEKMARDMKHLYNSALLNK